MFFVASRTVNTDGFKPNLESHLVPILATQLKSGVNKESPVKPHHPILLEVLVFSKSSVMQHYLQLNVLNFYV